MASIRRGMCHVEDDFHVYSPFSVPLHHYRWGRSANAALLRSQVAGAATRLGMRRPVVWVVCPAAHDAALRLSRSRLVYQRTDRYEEFRSEEGGYVDERIRTYDRSLRSRSDCVVYVSRALYEGERHGCRYAVLSDHGVDVERFAEAANDPLIPPGLEALTHPVVGFFGAIDDHTFDVGLAVEIARRLRDMTCVFVGHASCDVSELARLTNVRLLGQRPYAQIPHYGKCFDVAIMPWRRNRWIESCNPVKLREYLALGVPVVSVPFRQLDDYRDCVAVAETATDFEYAIRQTLRDDNAPLREMRRSKVRNCSWQSVADHLWSVLWQL